VCAFITLKVPAPGRLSALDSGRQPVTAAFNAPVGRSQRGMAVPPSIRSMSARGPMIVADGTF